MLLKHVEQYDLDVELLREMAHARRLSGSKPEQRCGQHWKTIVEDEDGEVADAGAVEVRAEPRARRRVESSTVPKCGGPKPYTYTCFSSAQHSTYGQNWTQALKS